MAGCFKDLGRAGWLWLVRVWLFFAGTAHPASIKDRRALLIAWVAVTSASMAGMLTADENHVWVSGGVVAAYTLLIAIMAGMGGTLLDRSLLGGDDVSSSGSGAAEWWAAQRGEPASLARIVRSSFVCDVDEVTGKHGNGVAVPVAEAQLLRATLAVIASVLSPAARVTWHVLRTEDGRPTAYVVSIGDLEFGERLPQNHHTMLCSLAKELRGSFIVSGSNCSVTVPARAVDDAV